MATDAPSLTFTRPVFAKLSPHPYLLRTLAADSPSTPSTRANGRTPRSARPVQIHPGSLSHAHGSALVRLGDTSVLCGVRGEILPVERIPLYRPRQTYTIDDDDDDNTQYDHIGRGELRDYDLLVPNIELATGCAPPFLPGGPPTALAQTLSTRVYSLLHSAGLIDASQLRIWYRPEAGQKGDEDRMQDEEEEEDAVIEEGKEARVVAYWVLYIDLTVISYDGSPFDAAWAAVLAALRNTKLPVARWDAELEAVVCSRSQREQLVVRGLPVACTAGVFLEKEKEAVGDGQDGRNWLLLDPDRFEEGLCSEVVTVVVDCGGEGGTRVRAIEKMGGTAIGRELIRGFIAVAETRWKEVAGVMGAV